LRTPETHSDFGALSWELPPSLDGNTEVQPVFYDYDGKDSGWGNDRTGTSNLPAVIAQRMPDGTTHYQYFIRNTHSLKTSETERWVEGGTVKYRTDTFAYATGTGNPAVDGLLMVKHVGPLGELIFGHELHPTYPDQARYETNALNEVITRGYDANRRPTATLTAAGLLSTYTYDATTQRLQKVVDSIAGTPLRTNSYTWLNGYMRTHTDPRGLVRTFTYDFLGRLVTVAYPDSTTEDYTYVLPAATGFNTSGSPLAVLDRVKFKDRLTNYWYSLPNRLRQVAKVIEPPKTSGGTAIETTISYCGCGAPSSVARASNTAAPETTYYDRNYQGGVTTLTQPDSSQQLFGYDSVGRLTSVTDSLMTLTTSYDNLGRVTSRQNAQGLVEGRSYDLRDRVLVSTSASGVVSTSSFDNLGRLLTRVAQGDSGLETYGYTANYAGPTSYINQVNDTTTWTYDAAQRKTGETVVGIATTTFIYNGADDLTELRDGKTQKTTWSYDSYGRTAAKYDDKGTNVLAYLYNANGGLTNRWSKQKGSTEYRYDGVGNLTVVNYPTTADLAFTYDALNRVTQEARSGVLTTLYTYAPGGQLASEETSQWASSKVTLGYGSRLRTSLALQQPGGIGDWTQSYAYDTARRLGSVGGSAGSFGYGYVAAAPSGSYASRLVQQITLPTTTAGPKIAQAYDTTGRLTETKMVNGATTFNRHAYVLNTAHQRTKQTRPDASYVDYAYDHAGQLDTGLTKTGGGSAVTGEQFDYGYDAAQNLTTRATGTGTTTYTVNSLNQVTSDGTSYSYDWNGNRTSGPGSPSTVTYEYDDENQLTAAYVPGYWKQTYTYDARLRVRVRSDYAWINGWYPNGEIRYVYDGMSILQERSSANVPQVTYTCGTDLSGTFGGAGGIGGLLARTAHSGTGGATYTPAFYHADGNGYVTYLLKLDQTAGAAYTYDPYGRTLASSGPLATANLMRFSSKPLWAASAGGGGLYYYSYRFYDPTQGRWVNRDPIEENGGINLYGAFLNNPQLYIDPFGEAPEWAHCALDIIGTFEPTPFADLINAGLYTGEGDKVNAAISMAGVIPYVGDLGKLAKYGFKGARAGEKAIAKQFRKPSSPGKMQKEVERGQAPRDIDRVDRPHPGSPEPHVHYTDGTSSTSSGRTKDKMRGEPNPPKKTREWLDGHNWTPPGGDSCPVK
jgi:RHS repeat-associated protein